MNRILLKGTIFATFLSAISLTFPANAELIAGETASERFFERGQTQLERQIQILQEQPESEDSQQKKPSLEIDPAVTEVDKNPNNLPRPSETENEEIETPGDRR